MSRELDGAIAEALGIKSCDKWRCVHFSRGDYIKECDCEKCLPSQYWPPRYSKNGNDMLELDREMRKRGWFIREIFSFERDVIVGYFHIEDDEITEAATGHANIEPLARALAAYQALTGKVLNEVIK